MQNNTGIIEFGSKYHQDFSLNLTVTITGCVNKGVLQKSFLGQFPHL